MEPGPLPPHERTWRHPSELGPTKADIDTGSSNHLAALAVGTLVVMAVAGLVVAMTPRTSPGPTALSATTAPVFARGPTEPTVASVDAARVATAASSGLTASRIPIGALLTSFSAFPHAITSGPQLTLDGTGIATRLPDDHDIVLVRTEAVTYELPWGEVPFLDMPDGSVIFDAAGALLAHVAGGELFTLVGD